MDISNRIKKIFQIRIEWLGFKENRMWLRFKEKGKRASFSCEPYLRTYKKLLRMFLEGQQTAYILYL